MTKKRLHWATGAILTLVLAGAGCAGTPSDDGPADQPTPAGGGTGRIVFSGDRPKDTGLNIYVMGADGSNQQAITEDFFAAIHPSASPDGSRVAFWFNDGGEKRIYVVDIDGSNLSTLTDFSSFEVDWSPDGSKLLIGADHRGENTDLADIYTLDLESGALEEILDTPTIRETGAKWSPDGSRILFSSNMTGNMEVYVMDADGSNLVQLTDDPHDDTHADWSPDGKKIAWSTCVASDNYDIWVMDADGSNKTRLLHSEFEEEDPAWSPDGTRIAFTSNRAGNYDIYSMNTDGTDIVQLTDHEGNEIMPDWVP